MRQIGSRFVHFWRRWIRRDSVLSKHLKQLEQAGYIVQDKVPKAGRNRTWIGLTDSGRVAFEKYVAQLKRLVAMAESGAPQGLG